MSEAAGSVAAHVNASSIGVVIDHGSIGSLHRWGIQEDEAIGADSKAAIAKVGHLLGRQLDGSV